MPRQLRPPERQGLLRALGRLRTIIRKKLGQPGVEGEDPSTGGHATGGAVRLIYGFFGDGTDATPSSVELHDMREDLIEAGEWRPVVEIILLLLWRLYLLLKRTKR